MALTVKIAAPDQDDEGALIGDTISVEVKGEKRETTLTVLIKVFFFDDSEDQVCDPLERAVPYEDGTARADFLIDSEECELESEETYLVIAVAKLVDGDEVLNSGGQTIYREKE